MVNDSDVVKNIRDYSFYFNAMDKSVPLKFKLINPWIKSTDKLVLDIGSGSGQLAYALATANPQTSILGIDECKEALKWASNRYQDKVTNLKFFGGEVSSFSVEKKADVIVACSVLHEVYSRTANPFQHLKETLQHLYNNLEQDGRLIIRDFVAPENSSGEVLIKHYKSDIVAGHSFHEFLQQRNIDKAFGIDYGDYILYFTNLRDAYEYIYRKDYHENWEPELEETYGFWTGTSAKAILWDAGFKLEYYGEIDNGWVIENRLNGKVELLDKDTLSIIPYPKYQCIIVARKS